MRYPIFLVPGLGGTRLKECDTNKLVWLNAPLFLDCTAKLIRILEVKYERGKFISKYDIKTDKSFGEVESISNISDPPTELGSQFDKMIRYLREICNYECGENLFGVPYDWRLIFDKTYWEIFSKSLKELIENQYFTCSNVKAVFITASLGGLVMTKFLKEQTSEWKTKHVSKLIMIAAPLGGTPRACLSLCNGIEDITGLDNYFIKDLFRNCAGTYMCQPNPICFKGLKILRNYNGRTYDISEMEKVFEIEHFETNHVKNVFTDTYPEALRIQDEGPGPEVETHVIYSEAVDTVLAIDCCNGEKMVKIKESNFENCPFGDGVVPYVSLSYWNCKKYKCGTPYLKSYKVFCGREYEHCEIFKKMEVMHYIKTLLTVSSIDDILADC